MVFTFIRPEVVHVVKEPLGILGNSVLKRWSAPCTMNCALSRCAVVASDIDDKSVVGNAHAV